jgi:hypothetical protein
MNDNIHQLKEAIYNNIEYAIFMDTNTKIHAVSIRISEVNIYAFGGFMDVQSAEQFAVLEITKYLQVNN